MNNNKVMDDKDYKSFQRKNKKELISFLDDSYSAIESLNGTLNKYRNKLTEKDNEIKSLKRKLFKYKRNTTWILILLNTIVLYLLIKVLI